MPQFPPQPRVLHLGRIVCWSPSWPTVPQVRGNPRPRRLSNCAGKGAPRSEQEKQLDSRETGYAKCILTKCPHGAVKGRVPLVPGRSAVSTHPSGGLLGLRVGEGGEVGGVVPPGDEQAAEYFSGGSTEVCPDE